MLPIIISQRRKTKKGLTLSIISTQLNKLLTNIFLSQIKLPRDIHRYAFRKYPNRIALQFTDNAVTYAQLQNRAFRLVQAWHAMGIKQGHAVFTQIETAQEFFEIRTAALEAGIILTGFHAQHSPEFVSNAAQKLNPKLFIIDQAFAPNTQQAISQAVPNIPIWSIGQHGEYNQQIAAHTASPSTQKPSPSDPMTLAFTSGTTGAPKGLISSHGAAVASLKLLIKNLKIKPDRNAINISMSAIPIFGAGSGLIFPSMLSGGTLVVMNDYTPETMITLIKKHKVTRLFLTPSQLIDLLETPTSIDEDLASLSSIIYGTSCMPAAKLEEAIIRFGPIFQQGYGQAELLPPVSMLSPEDHMQNGIPARRHILQSCGKVVKGVKLRIADANNNSLPTNSIGQIHVKSPTRLQTYLDPAQNKGVILNDGYFCTGDHGYLDAEGFLHVIDREADIISSKNGTIYPRLVEEPAHDHPAIRECCLVEKNNHPILFISLRTNYKNADQATIIQEVHTLLSQRLPANNLPHEIRVLITIPRSFLGKVMRKEVRNKTK